MMNDKGTISKELFIKRFTTLCIKSGSSEFPKDERDQHILLKSAMIQIGAGGPFSESEINDRLEKWVSEICQMPNVDRAMMRRRLVDTGYLKRATDGSSYTIVTAGSQAYGFDEQIDQLDLLQELNAARDEIARRKKEYMEKASKGSK
jgi:hypothetical protein